MIEKKSKKEVNIWLMHINAAAQRLVGGGSGSGGSSGGGRLLGSK